MSVKRGMLVFLVLTALQAGLYFSGALIGLIMLPVVGIIVWILFLPGSLLFEFISGADATLVRMYPYLDVFPILFNSVIYTSLFMLLTKVRPRAKSHS